LKKDPIVNLKPSWIAYLTSCAEAKALDALAITHKSKSDELSRAIEDDCFRRKELLLESSKLLAEGYILKATSPKATSITKSTKSSKLIAEGENLKLQSGDLKLDIQLTSRYNDFRNQYYVCKNKAHLIMDDAEKLWRKNVVDVHGNIEMVWVPRKGFVDDCILETGELFRGDASIDILLPGHVIGYTTILEQFIGTDLEQFRGTVIDRMVLSLGVCNYPGYKPAVLYQLTYLEYIENSAFDFTSRYTELFKESDKDAAIAAFHERANCGNPLLSADMRGLRSNRTIDDVCDRESPP
jgi:hypothetical protein